MNVAAEEWRAFVGWSRTASRLAFVIAVACAQGGCGSAPRFAPVTGQATIDGLPLENVLVTFIPDVQGNSPSVRSMGVTDAAGRFQLKSETLQTGAIMGPHRVTVEDLAIHAAPRSDDGTVLTMPAPRFPQQYSHVLSCPITANVSSGVNQIELSLKSDAFP